MGEKEGVDAFSVAVEDAVHYSYKPGFAFEVVKPKLSLLPFSKLDVVTSFNLHMNVGTLFQHMAENNLYVDY